MARLHVMNLLPVSFNTESCFPDFPCFIEFLHFIHARCARTSFKRSAQSRKLIRRATRKYLDSAIISIAHPSTYTHSRSLTFHKPAEPNSLNASGNYIATSHENAASSWLLCA